MKTTPCQPSGRHGLTMPELIGAIAIFATLCALLAMPIYGIIDDARLAADLKSIAALQKATEEYFNAKGTFAGPNGAVLVWTGTNNSAYEYWDRKVLLPEGFLQRTFKSKLGGESYLRLTKVTATSTATVIASTGNVGHHGTNGWLCNNGLYSLTGQYPVRYAANPAPGGGVNAYASAYPPGPPPITGGWRERLGNFTPQPMLACLPMVAGRDSPPPTPASGPQPVDPRYTSGWDVTTDSMDVPTSFASTDPNNPVIVAEIVIEGVPVGDAYRLSVALEGFAQSIWAYADVIGRVKYDMYDTTSGLKGAEKGMVYIYLARMPIR